MIISFAWTTPALLAGEKTVTRREWTPDYADRFRGGDHVDAWDKQPRFRGRQVAMIELRSKPYLESTAMISSADYEAEGFAYLSSIGAMVNGKRPEEFWIDWKRHPRSLWVVRFKLLAIVDEVVAEMKDDEPPPAEPPPSGQQAWWAQ